MAELVDALVSGTSAARRGGSSPLLGTICSFRRRSQAFTLKDWALAIAKRSTMRKARIALARRLAIIMHAMLRHGTEFKAA
jgi:hypothetical protein